MKLRPVLVATLVLLPLCAALDNGLGLLPPLAWRSWNAFHTSFNQSTIHDMVDALVNKSHTVSGVPTSLQDLGYNMIGIDEGWEGCGMGVNGTQHYANGTPAVKPDFPDLKALVDYGHSKGVKMGFYLNGCACGERQEHRINYEGDVNFTVELGFDGVKIDSCGAQKNMTLYAALFNATGKALLIENCHQGQNFTDGGDPGQMGEGWCPYNSFRTSGDIINVWDRVIENLMSVVKFLTPQPKPGSGASPIGRDAEPPIFFPPPGPPHATPGLPLSRPGCWAYPDMLEVGRMEVAGETDLAESAHESASHFAAWTMVSAPLVLGFDLTNTTRLGLAWPTISNKLAMSVSQSWESDRADPSGSLIRSWQSLTKTSIVVGCGAGCNCADNPRAQPNCERWAKAGQCTANPGYMHAECAAACPSSLNASGWKLNGQSMVAPNGECVDVAGQLTPAPGSGLNWLRTVKCDATSKTQQWTLANHTLKSAATGQCLGVESHWLWGQPMVSVISCGGSKTQLTLSSNGTLSSGSGGGAFGCFGTSNTAGPLSTLWRKPMAGNKTAVLAINGAALAAPIRILVKEVLAPDGNGHTKATATDVWSGKVVGEPKKTATMTVTVPPHGNIFLILSDTS